MIGPALSADLIRFLASHLAPGAVDDDVMLEGVMLLGALACDEAADDMVAAGVPGRLYALMSAQKDDDEFVLQTCWTFYRLLLVPASRNALLRGTQVVIYLVDLLQDEHAEIARIAGLALDAVTDHDEEWASRIRGLKFEAHNAEWIEAVESTHSPGPDDGSAEARAAAAAAGEEFDEGRYHGGGRYGSSYGDGGGGGGGGGGYGGEDLQSGGYYDYASQGGLSDSGGASPQARCAGGRPDQRDGRMTGGEEQRALRGERGAFGSSQRRGCWPATPPLLPHDVSLC